MEDKSAIAYAITSAILTLVIGSIIFFSSTMTAKASEISDDNTIIECIIGEAEGEGYDGMLAVAEAIRNRGTLRGVYGCKAKRVVNKMYSTAIYKTANKAWHDSAHTNTVAGATHWEGTAFKTPYWAKDMIITATIRNQRFYK